MDKQRLNLLNIEKRFSEKIILSNINFTVNRNEIVGLLGPNGAGKTTALHITTSVNKPDIKREKVSCKFSTIKHEGYR